MKKHLLKGFTLVEATITTIIIAILVGILFSVFLTISRLAVKVQLEQATHNELVFLMQTVQNLVDEGSFSFSGYDVNSLEGTYGYVDELLLSGSYYTYRMFRSCELTGAECSVVLERFDPLLVQTTEFQLTDPARVEIDNFYIKLLPYGPQSVSSNVQHQGFWIFIDATSPLYNERQWRFRVGQKIETFFNVRTY